jgi:hypothetical protein
MIARTPGADRPGGSPGERPIGLCERRTNRDGRGREELKGASEFDHLGDLLTEEQWQMMKPKKRA